MIINGEETTLQSILTKSIGSIKRLSPEEIGPYFYNLDKQLSALGKILSEDAFKEDAFLIPFIQQVRETYKCLKLKHSVTGIDAIDFSLTINPKDSGFPTFKDLHYLENDKKRAAEILDGQLPKEKQIIDSMRWAIFGKRPIEHEQILLKRHRYFSKLLKTELLPALSVCSKKPDLIREEGKNRYYVKDWYFTDSESNMPVYYRMWFIQSGGHWPSNLEQEAHPKLESIIESSRRGIENLKSFVWHLDQQIDELHPQMIKKYTIGPYNDTVTSNHKGLDILFEGVKMPSSLKFQAEMVLSVDVEEKPIRGRWEYFKSLFTDRVIKEVYSEVKLMHNVMIVPNRVKQKLKRNCDENGAQCEIYSLPNGGVE